MRFRKILAPLLLALALPALAAADVTIKLGTLAPDGSAWHKLLKEMADRWGKASGGKVKLKIYAGGISGNEGDTIRKMRVGQLQAAALSVVGLRDIEPSPQAIAIPGVITNQQEWDYVFPKLTPVWNERITKKGFVPIMWTDAGSIHLFSKKELTSPASFKGTRIFAWAGDPASVEAWKAVGFQPVVLSATDILPSLSTGMIDAFATTPSMGFLTRWYEQAKFMVAFPWGHMPIGTVVTAEAWEKVPSELRPVLLQIAREFEGRVNAEAAKMTAESIAQMKKGGLKVVEIDDAGFAAWTAATEKTWTVVRGGVVPVADFDEARRLRDEARAIAAKKKPAAPPAKK